MKQSPQMVALIKAEKARRYIEQELDRCKTDTAYFIESYVRIEDRDKAGGDISIPFELWDAQKDALKHFESGRLNIILKARQMGFTWLALSFAAREMRFKPGYAVTALSKIEDDAKELVRRLKFILTRLPKWMIREKTKDLDPNYTGPTWEGTTLSVTIHHPDGDDSRFVALAAGPEAGRSLTGNLIIIDEWAFQQFAQTIWDAAYPTVNRPTGGKVIGISTSKRGSFFNELYDKARAGLNGFKALFYPWHSDPRRDHAWYEQTKLELPNSYRREYPATVDEAYTVGDEAWAREWDERIHVPFDETWYPPASWKLYRVYDGGWTRACCKWYAVSGEGDAVCYREYYPTMTTDDEQAAMIRQLSVDDDGNPEHIAQTFGDGACWSKQPGAGKSTAEIFQANGINMMPLYAEKDKILGCKALHRWLAPFESGKVDGKGNLVKIARLMFTKACRNTMRIYPTLECDKTNPDLYDSSGEDHPIDCDKYFVMAPISAPESKREKDRRMQARRDMRRPGVSSVTGY